MTVRLSAGAQLAWQFGVSETLLAKHQYIEKEQLFIGICSLEKVLVPGALKEVDPAIIQEIQAENDAIKDLFKSFKLEPKSIRRLLREKVGQGNYTHTGKVINRSEACKECFNNAETIAQKQGSDEVCCLDLIAAIMAKPGSHIKEVLKRLNITAEDIGKAALAEKERLKASLIRKYGTDLTKLAREKKLDPLIGRRDELLQVIRTLTRK
jgi:ATP-dependent Clp protease ATP-binding subunit ClpA